MTKEEYDAMPIEEKPIYVAMVKREGRWVLHRTHRSGTFASKEGLIRAMGEEEVAVFKLEYEGKTWTPFSKEEK